MRSILGLLFVLAISLISTPIFQSLVIAQNTQTETALIVAAVNYLVENYNPSVGLFPKFQTATRTGCTAIIFLLL